MKRYISFIISFVLIFSSVAVADAAVATPTDPKGLGSTDNTSFKVLAYGTSSSYPKETQTILNYEGEFQKTGLISFHFSFFSTNSFSVDDVKNNIQITDTYMSIFDFNVFSYSYSVGTNSSRYMYSVSCLATVRKGTYSILVDWLGGLSCIDFKINYMLTYFPDIYNYELVDKFALGVDYSNNDETLFSRELESGSFYFGFMFSQDLLCYELLNPDYYFVQGGRRNVGVFSISSQENLNIKYSQISTFQLFKITAAAGYNPSETDDNQSILSRLFNVILGLPEAIFDLFKDFLNFLFVPSDGFFREQFTQISDKFGFYDGFFDCFEKFNEKVKNFDSTAPSVKIDLSAANSIYDWGTSSITIDLSWFSPYRQTVQTVISVIIWTFFIWRSFMHLSNTISGSSLLSEFSSNFNPIEIGSRPKTATTGILVVKQDKGAIETSRRKR